MISEAFTQMESHKLQLEKRLEEQRVHMRSACVQRLIHASEQDPYNLEEMLCDCGIAIPGGVLIECLGAQPLEASRAMLLEILDQHRTHFTFLSFEKSNVISCLFSQQEEERIDVRALFSQFYEMLRSTCGFDMAIYVGTPCDALEKIAQSFATAEWLMRTSQHTEWLRQRGFEQHLATGNRKESGKLRDDRRPGLGSANALLPVPAQFCGKPFAGL